MANQQTNQQRYYDSNRVPDQRRTANQPDGCRHWQVSEMWDLHHEIARRLVLGQKNTEIARDLGIHKQTVSNVRNSPVVQEQMALLNGARNAETMDLAQEIAEIAPVALQLLKEIVEGEGQGTNAPLSLRAREANNMLARVGHGVPQRVQSESVNVFLTSKDIAEIKQRARANRDVIDVTPEDSEGETNDG